MSKKSRRRNKRLLALAGLAGAVALSNRKAKADLASTEDGKSAKSTPVPTGPKELGISTRAKKSIDTGTGRDFGKSSPKYEPKKTRIRPFRTLDLGIPEGSKALKLKDNSIRAKNRQISAAGIKEPNKPMIASLFPKSQTADNYRADMQDFGRTNQYKSGGRVKGCGIAKRGFGKAMKKGKR